MTRPQRCFLLLSFLLFSASIANAQVGFANGLANSLLKCSAPEIVPLLRPEGYSEVVGDILIECTGGPVLPQGAAVPTTNVIVYMNPAVPITSRFLSSNGASEALLIIDEAGANVTTGVTANYGPKATQSLCTTTAQQTTPSPCSAVVASAAGIDINGNPVNYEVSVLPEGTTPAPNVFQGKVGDFGANSVTFYNVPVLPPATTGVLRTFRITNIRVPVPGGNLTNTLQAIISTTPSQVLPISGAPIDIGHVGAAMTATVTASPSGGGKPFTACGPLSTPTLAAQLTFSEGFATAFKTRVIPGGTSLADTMWAAQAPNITSSANQNIPGGIYAGFWTNDESGLILPALSYTDRNNNTTYTAGLSDFGTRLKAVFSNIPAGVTIYAATTSTGTVAIPGGTAVTPYAVLVGASQSDETAGDGANFAPLTSTLLATDGQPVYQLPFDYSGNAVSIWEVVNSNPESQDVFTFNIYLSYTSTLGTVNPTSVALSLSPEPSGGAFPTANATAGLVGPQPRFAVLQTQGGPFATINQCPISVTGGTPVNFAYSVGGANPSAAILPITTHPAGLIVTASTSVASPSGGKWLLATVANGNLTISVDNAGLPTTSAVYTGTVKLSAANSPDLSIPVNLTVYPPDQFRVSVTHAGNFAQGQTGSYTIVVSNASPTVPTGGTLTVTENLPPGLSLVSMSGAGWNCNTLPNCWRSDSLAGGASFAVITASVNVSSSAASSQLNGVTATSAGLLDQFAYDSTVVTSMACDINQDSSFTIKDLQMALNQALGLASRTNDLNSDGVVNLVDLRIVLNAVMNQSCVI
jgi:uncharacterized repeat protein (TIGR01451 family)